MTAAAAVIEEHCAEEAPPVTITEEMIAGLMTLSTLIISAVVGRRLSYSLVMAKLQEIHASQLNEEFDPLKANAKMLKAFGFLDDQAILRDLYGLTERETELLRYLKEGLKNSEIAEKFWIAPQTVKFHLTNIYRKMDARNRTDAVRLYNEAVQ